MGAIDLLSHLQGAGFALRAEAGKLVVTPASALTDEARLSIRQHRDALIDALTEARGESAVAAAVVGQSQPHKLAQALPDVAQADAKDEAATARFQARAVHCRRLGLTADEAEDLAEQLHLRDLHADFRHLCVECQHYRRGRCGNHAAAALATNVVGRELATMFQNCPGFQLTR